jgi:predicted RNA-binding Zn ribbon-like protein
MAAPIRARFLADGSTRLEPCSSGFTGVVVRFVATVARARLNNRWPRLKICADDACRRVFYDESRAIPYRGPGGCLREPNVRESV